MDLNLFIFLLIGGFAALWIFSYLYFGKKAFYYYVRVYYGVILLIFAVTTAIWYWNKPTEPEYR